MRFVHSLELLQVGENNNMPKIDVSESVHISKINIIFGYIDK